MQMTTVDLIPARTIRRPVELHHATVRGSARLALMGTAASVPPITALHLAADGPVEPVAWTISDYVVSLPNGILLFGLTTAALAIGAGALVRGLSNVAGTARLRMVFGLWATALLVAAVFPTNVRGTPENISSQIHLYAGAVAFAALPIAGWMLFRWQRRSGASGLWTRTLGVVSLASGVLSLALILNRLPGEIGMPELMLPPGILQRVAGAIEIMLLAVAALAVLRTARRGSARIAW
jgi:Protein of unknown function (DUF998)